MSTTKITDDNIYSVNSTKITGAVNASCFPAVLPAVSGANLTNLPGSALGFKNISGWADGETQTISLTSNAGGLGKAAIQVWEEIADPNKTNADWDIATNDSGFDLTDSAYAQTLTPAATTGAEIEFTMGGGTFASTDVGKVITNTSSGETGEARIISIASNVATCKITTDFTNTDAIASGDWTMLAGEFTSGSFAVSNASVSGNGFAGIESRNTTGSLQLIDDKTTNDTHILRITDSTFLVLRAGYSMPSLRHGTIDSDGTITYGPTQNDLGGGSMRFGKILMITPTKFVVVWQQELNNKYGYAGVMTLSGTTLSRSGGLRQFDYNGAEDIDAVHLSGNNFVVFYREYSTGEPHVIAGQVDGNEVYFNIDNQGSPISTSLHVGGDARFCQIERISDTSALCLWSKGGKPDACVIEVPNITEDPWGYSGVLAPITVNTITSLDNIYFDVNMNPTNGYIEGVSTHSFGTHTMYELARVSSTQFVYGCKNGNYSNGGKPCLVLINVSGTTPTFVNAISMFPEPWDPNNQSIRFYGDSSFYIQGGSVDRGNTIFMWNETEGALIYDIGAGANVWTTLYHPFTISGNTLTAGTHSLLTSSFTDQSLMPSAAMLTSTTAVAAYKVADGTPNAAMGVSFINKDSVYGTTLAYDPQYFYGKFMPFDNNRMVKLTDNKFLVVGHDHGNSDKGGAIVVENLSGNNLTSAVTKANRTSTIAEFGSGYTYAFGLAAISATKAVVTYRQGSDMKANVLTISGTTITVGPEHTITGATGGGGAWGYYAELVKMTDTILLLNYSQTNYDNATFMRVLIVSGTSISSGYGDFSSDGFHQRRGIVRLEDDQAMMVGYNHNEISSSTHELTACMVYVASDGSSFAQYPNYTFGTTNPEISIAALSSTKVLVTFGESSYTGGHRGKMGAFVLTKGANIGNPITSGPVTNHLTNETAENGRCGYVASFSPTKAVFTWYSDIAPNEGKAVVLNISASDVVSTESQFIWGPGYNHNGGSGFHVLALNSKTAVFSYRYGMKAMGLSSSAYVTNQYVTTISGTDSIDTSNYVDLNSMTVTETLNGGTANFAFSTNSTPSSSTVTGGTFFVIGSGQTTTRDIASSLNSVHGGTEGEWYINNNTTYGSTTWVAAATNETKEAISEATAITANQMSGTTVNAVADTTWPALGTQLSVAITLYSTDNSSSPTVDGISFNYDGAMINRDRTGQYVIEMPSVSSIKVTAPSSGGPRNARVYINS